MALKSGRVGIHPSQVDPITGMLLSGPSGSTNYNDLSNKPQINGVTLSGNKTTSDLHIEAGASDLSDLDDVAISTPEAGQLLIYDGDKWENQFASISPVTPATLASLQDVRISSVSDNQILRYNSTASKWENEDMPAIPAAQVNSDWNAVSGVAEILNKPTIPAAQVNSDWDAVSGVAEILNKPTIPATVSDLTNGYVISSAVTALAGATSATITNSNIHSTSIIEVFADNGTNTPLSSPTITVTEGHAVLAFSALSADTSFKLRITN